MTFTHCFEAKILLPIEQPKGFLDIQPKPYSNPLMTSGLNAIKSYLSKGGVRLLSNMDQARFHSDDGPFHETYHYVDLQNNAIATVSLLRSLGQFHMVGRGDDLRPIGRRGPDTLTILVVSSSDSSNNSSQVFLETLLTVGSLNPYATLTKRL